MSTLANELASVANGQPGTGATATELFHGLIRDQVVQVQANVRGIDGNRTDVVTVQTPVRLRPDLEVSNVLNFLLVESTTNTPSYRNCYSYPDVNYCYLGGYRVTSKTGSGSAGP